MKRSSANDIVCDDANKRICNRNFTHVYAYAITSSDPVGWHAYCGYVPNVPECVNGIAAVLTDEVEKFGMKMCKVRWQIRVVSGEGMATYSSIIVFVDDVFDMPSQPVSIAIKSCLFKYLSHHVPVYYGHQYVLRDMTISDGVAFVVCPPNANISMCEYHNEWFSQPIGELVSWDGSEHYNTLRIFECMDGKIDVFRGNNTNECVVMIMGNDNKPIRYSSA